MCSFLYACYHSLHNNIYLIKYNKLYIDNTPQGKLKIEQNEWRVNYKRCKNVE